MENRDTMRKRGRPKSKPCPFGKNLCAVMSERDLSLRQVAKMAGVGVSTVMSWRSGSNPGDLLAIKSLAEALKIDFCVLLTGSNVCKSATVPVAQIQPDLHEAVIDGFVRVLIQRLGVPQVQEESRKV